MLLTLLWNLSCCSPTTIHQTGYCQSRWKTGENFKVAHELSSVQKSKFLKRRAEIIEKRQAAVLRKEQESIRKREKEVRLKEALTKQIQRVGLWTSRSEVEEGLRKLKTATSKRDTLKLQINFRRKVLRRLNAHWQKCIRLLTQRKTAYTRSTNSQFDPAFAFRARAAATTWYRVVHSESRAAGE